MDHKQTKEKLINKKEKEMTIDQTEKKIQKHTIQILKEMQQLRLLKLEYHPKKEWTGYQ